jgi:hypothetical protein
MGVVYLAVDSDLDREVALKMVQPSLARDERSLARFKKEARAVAALSHPNVVHINALTEIDGVLLIEMPYLPAGSLRDFAGRPLRAEVVASVLDRILDALACCHEHGIIHRDVKPSNVLFDAGGVPKLSDFGAVALLESEWSQGQGERTLTLSFSGTPQYCCPEAWDGQSPTPQWDLYALGMVARELLCSSAIRPVTTPLAHIRQLLESEVEPIRDLVPALSEAFGTLIDDLCARDPERRPASAAEAQTRLRDTPEYVLNESADARTLDLGSSRDAWRRTSARPRRKWQGSSLVFRVTPWVLLLLLAVTWTWGWIRTPEAAKRPDVAPAPAVVKTQWERFHTDTPAPEELESLSRESVLGRTHVYTVRSASAPGLEAPFLVRKLPDAGATAMGKLDHDLHFLQILPAADGGGWRITGFAGDFTQGAVPVPRLARVYGTATWDGKVGAPLWLALEYESELAQEDWSDALFASAESPDMTDTAVILSWERDRSAMPFLFRELMPRFPNQLAPFIEQLPAVAEARLSAPLELESRDLAALGSVAEVRERMGASLAGRPQQTGAWLAADRAPDRFRIVLGLPAVKIAPRTVDINVMARYGVPLNTSWSTWAGFASGEWHAARRRGEEQSPVAPDWTAQVRDLPDGQLIVVELGLDSLYAGTPPVPGEWHRLNVRVDYPEDSSVNHVEWGWPDATLTEHGALVELLF